MADNTSEIARDRRPPGLPLLLREVGAFAAMRVLARFGPAVASAKAASPRATIVLPGFMADDNTTARLRRSLELSGHPAFGWALGRNRGITSDIMERVDARVAAIQAQAGLDAPVNLVGWSLGGLIAREYSKHAPKRVAKVVTLGSPFSGDIRGNNAWRAYEFISGHKVDDPPIPAVLTEKPPMQTVALWSRRDGVVAPASARGELDEADARFELDCTHMGFVSRPSAIQAIARVLAEA